MCVPAVKDDFDELHARFDQPPRHEAAASEVAVAVGLPHGFGFFADVERFEARRVHQLNRFGVNVVALFHFLVARLLRELLL